MTTFVSQVFLESALFPAVLSGLIVFSTRWSSHRVLLLSAGAAAFLAATLLSYGLVFGWQVSPALGARQKIMLLTVVGTLLAMGFSLDESRFDRPMTILQILGPLWIGWPALIGTRPSLGFLILPMIVGLWVQSRFKRRTDDATELYLLLVAMALGLAAIALFARTLSLAQISLALAATLTAIVLAGPRPPFSMMAIAGITMLSGLLSALLLYSEASLPAIIVLCAVLCSPSLARLLAPRPLWPSLLIAAAIAIVAAGIAWIDAGSISVYEGAQHDGAVSQKFVLRGFAELRSTKG